MSSLKSLYCSPLVQIVLLGFVCLCCPVSIHYIYIYMYIPVKKKYDQLINIIFILFYKQYRVSLMLSQPCKLT